MKKIMEKLTDEKVEAFKKAATPAMKKVCVLACVTLPCKSMWWYSSWPEEVP